MRARVTVLALALLGGGCSPAPVEVATLGSGALSNGLIAHWALDEATGVTANDGSGNGHTGMLEGPAYAWTTARFGAGVHFSGADWVMVPGFPRPTSSYTVSAWVLIASSELGPPIANLISTEAAGGGWSLFATLSSGALSYVFRFAGNGPQQYWVATCNCLVPDSWTHVTAVLDADAGTLSLHVGAAAPVTIPAAVSVIPGSSTLAIGRSAGLQPPFPVTGALDDVAIYNRALAPEEIAALGVGPVPDPQ